MHKVHFISNSATECAASVTAKVAHPEAATGTTTAVAFGTSRASASYFGHSSATHSHCLRPRTLFGALSSRLETHAHDYI